MTKIYAGIDPGKTGAVAFVHEDGEFINYCDCPKSLEGMLDILDLSHPNLDELGYKVAGVAIEKAQPFVMKGEKQGIKSMFEYGGNYYSWRMACVALKIPHLTPHPKLWQKILDSPMKLKGKQRVLEYVRRRWPRTTLIGKNDHHRRDAMVLAEYARRELR